MLAPWDSAELGQEVQVEGSGDEEEAQGDSEGEEVVAGAEGAAGHEPHPAEHVEVRPGCH